MIFALKHKEIELAYKAEEEATLLFVWFLRTADGLDPGLWCFDLSQDTIPSKTNNRIPG